MPQTTHLSVASWNLALNAALDAALAGGYLEIYDSTGTGQPATPDVAVTTQVKLAKLSLGTPAFAAASGGSKLANAIASASAITNGTATWFRAFKSDDSTAVIDGSCGITPASTTVAVASDGVALPTGTINVASTAGFPTTGIANVVTSAGVEAVNYTGATGTSLTGCTGGTGTMKAGNTVTVSPDMVLNTTAIVTGATVAITSWTVAMPVGQ